MVPRFNPQLARVSAVAVGRGRLAIVTLDYCGSEVQVDDAASIAATLDTDSGAVSKMRSALNEFLDRNHIRDLVLRKGPHRGPYSVRAIQMKLEFLVEHGLRVAATPVFSSTLGNWLNKHQIEAPPGLPDFGKEYRECQFQAVQTGFYALDVYEGFST